MRETDLDWKKRARAIDGSIGGGGGAESLYRTRLGARLLPQHITLGTYLDIKVHQVEVQGQNIRGHIS